MKCNVTTSHSRFCTPRANESEFFNCFLKSPTKLLTLPSPVKSDMLLATINYYANKLILDVMNMPNWSHKIKLLVLAAYNALIQFSDLFFLRLPGNVLSVSALHKRLV